MGRKLTYTFDETGGHSTLSVEPTGRDSFDNRVEYRWYVNTGTQEFTGDRIRSGCGANVDLPDALASLFSFLIAFAEARQHGSPQSDGWDLFPDGLAEWATLLSDELTMAQLEIDANR